MKRFIILFLSLLMLFSFTACTESSVDSSDKKITVAVGIVPEATFVEKVAGDLVDIITMIPPGNSPANYQPTAAQMQAFSEASVYFAMQTPTEEANILPKVADFNKDIKIVLLRDVVSKTYPNLLVTGHDHNEDEHLEEETEHPDEEDEHLHEEDEKTPDPHIWLSPKRVIIIVQTIADTLSELDNANKEIYQKNAQEYIKELEAMDASIKIIAENCENKTFLIYHGAYGYFAQEYGFEMISLESEGKQVTAAKMQEVIDFANSEGITTVYYQEEFDDNQAKTVAEEINGNVKKASPLSPDYIASLTEFANALSQQGE